MCSEIDRFSSFLRRMSNNDNEQQFFLEEKVELEKSSQPRSKNAESCQEIEPGFVQEKKREILERRSTTDRHKEEEEQEEEEEAGGGDEKDKEIKNDENDVATVSSKEQEKAVSEDDDGFKTPTSLDCKIPAITQCPPAPKKTRPQPSKLKRKASTDRTRRSLQFDDLTEVESIFRPTPNEDNTESRKSRKLQETD